MNLGKSLTRTAAAVAATVLVTVGATGPADAKSDHGPKNAAHGHSKATQQARTGKAAGSHERAGSHEAAKSHKGARSSKAAAPSRGRGQANPPRHIPVTVCHRLGNGGYHVLTFDDSALKAHQAHGDIYPVPAGRCPSAAGSDGSTPQPDGDAPTPPKHTPVTVCHLLGNGGYHLLTFDDSALKAHLAHGDLYPVPASGCPTTAQVPGTTTPGTTTPGTTTTPGGTPEVAGVSATLEADRVLTARRPAAVLGVEADATETPAATRPSSGILPQTGAQPMALALTGGLGLLAAGGLVLARRRAAAQS